MPTDVEKPSSEARRAMVSASSGLLHAGADDAVDVDVEARVLGQVLQLLVERLEALLRDLVGRDVVDRDLQILEPGLVEPLDALGAEVEAVGDEPGQHAAVADAADDGVELGVHHRLAAGDGDDAGAQLAELVDAAQHLRERHRVRGLVVLVAVGAGEVAAAHGNDLRQDGMRRVEQTPRDHSHFTNGAGNTLWVTVSILSSRP